MGLSGGGEADNTDSGLRMTTLRGGVVEKKDSGLQGDQRNEEITRGSSKYQGRHNQQCKMQHGDLINVLE